jgi:hypothetical protein
MFDITADHIEQLEDEALRELIARLCEAEVRLHGQSPLCVTYGGHQNSPDGGIDVRVSLDQTLPKSSNLPRSRIGFQVKAEDMPRSAVLAEMRPGGSLRTSIQTLAQEAGAYILVSSRSSLSDLSLQNRIDAMNEAVADEANALNLSLDFYDQTRIATWVRQHPGIVLWVRSKIGKSIQGWRPFGDWSGADHGAETTYLLDEKIRLSTPSNMASVSAEAGLEEIRKRLASPGTSVRLVGLSGTGKTRFVEALFDPRVGTGALPQYLAVYTNISDDPSPQPVALASDLISQRGRAVLIVDNCQPELHRTLTKTCRQTDSTLSLLTVEYDVRDDQPEDTDVFELQPASDELIKQLVRRRFQNLSRVNIDTLTGLSGGNARVALALAATVGPGESLAELRDVDLFQRLFQQRQNEDRSLLRTAQACSLVYSFQGEDTSTVHDAEMWRLAGLACIDVRSFHENVAEIHRRDLIQKRGKWRALLPHAIANRLAALALENIPAADIKDFWQSLPERMLRSFSRRLSYLHSSPHAVALVKGWLAPDGFLGSVKVLNELGRTMLVNVAPVAPADTLDFIARASSRRQTDGSRLIGEEYGSLVRSLAFEATMFDRAFGVLVDLVEGSEPNRFANAPKNDLPSLFHFVLSGTHATVEQRVSAVEGLVNSDSGERQELGLSCLNGLLQTPPFSSFQQFDFGARLRDFGYEPRSQDDLEHWFSCVLALCDRLDDKTLEISERVRTLVAQHLQGIWNLGVAHDQLEELFKRFAHKRYWPEAWIAARSLRKFRDNILPEEEADRLLRMEAALQPSTLQERVRVFVLRRARSAWDDIDPRDYEAQLARLEATAIELGKLATENEPAFDEILPELMSVETTMSVGAFAKGIVDNSSDITLVWARAVHALETLDTGKRNVEFLACLLFNLSKGDAAKTSALLKGAFSNPILKPFYPYLQSRVVTDSDGLRRLSELLADESISVERFSNVGWARECVGDDEFATLLPSIAGKPNGFSVALDGAWIRMAVGGKNGQPPASDALIRAAQKILIGHKFERANAFENYHYQEVVQHCFVGQGQEDAVRSILQNLQAAVYPGFGIGFHDAAPVLAALVAVQPLVTLDVVFEGRSTRERRGLDDLLEWHDSSALNGIPADTLLEWCDQHPIERYPWAASNLRFFNKDQTSETRCWSPTARALLQRAPNRTEVMKHYMFQLRPMSWSGSRAVAWEMNLKVLDDFDAEGDEQLHEFVREQQKLHAEQIEQARAEEEVSERKENETFE